MEVARLRRRISALEKKAPVAVARLSRELTREKKNLKWTWNEIRRQRKYIKRLKERIEKMKGRGGKGGRKVTKMTDELEPESLLNDPMWNLKGAVVDPARYKLGMFPGRKKDGTDVPLVESTDEKSGLSFYFHLTIHNPPLDDTIPLRLKSCGGHAGPVHSVNIC
jgi:hypothetical protein